MIKVTDGHDTAQGVFQFP